VGITGLEEARALSSFVEWTPHVRPGERIERTRDLENTLGLVHLANTSRDRLLEDLAAVHKLVNPELRVEGGIRTCAP
jgi:hypothetical protein